MHSPKLEIANRPVPIAGKNSTTVPAKVLKLGKIILSASTSRKKGKEVCPTHFIRAVILEEMVPWHLQYVTSFVTAYEDIFREKMNAKHTADRKKQVMLRRKQIAQAERERRIAELSKLDEQEQHADDVEWFICKCKQYTDLTELTPTILNDLVSKVFVEAPNKSDGKRRQNIHISYDLVGILPELNNPIHEEMA